MFFNDRRMGAQTPSKPGGMMNQPGISNMPSFRPKNAPSTGIPKTNMPSRVPANPSKGIAGMPKTNL